MLAFGVLVHNLLQAGVKVAVRTPSVRARGLRSSLRLGVGVRDFIEHFGGGLLLPEESQLPPTDFSHGGPGAQAGLSAGPNGRDKGHWVEGMDTWTRVHSQL